MAINFSLYRTNGNLDGRFAGGGGDPSGPLDVSLNNGVLTITTDGTYDFGRIKGVIVKDGEAILGPPIVFTKENIANYNF